MPEISNSYTPTTWVTGDTITATKLNNLEQGIQNATNTNKLYLCTDTNDTLDRTYNNIKNALLANKNIFLVKTINNQTIYSRLLRLDKTSNYYYAEFFNVGEYQSTSADSNLFIPLSADQ